MIENQTKQYLIISVFIKFAPYLFYTQRERLLSIIKIFRRHKKTIESNLIKQVSIFFSISNYSYIAYQDILKLFHD